MFENFKFNWVFESDLNILKHKNAASIEIKSNKSVIDAFHKGSVIY